MTSGIDLFMAPTIEEALKMLDRQRGKARVIAGGTDIIPGLRQGAGRFRKTRLLIDINRIPALKSIRKTSNGISVGAAATFSEILKDPLLAESYPMLVAAAGMLGSAQIRNRATIGGNLVNNAPCADGVPALLVYQARLLIRSAEGSREIALEDFLLQPYQTRLQPEELVCEILLPPPPPGYRGEFYKLGRRRGVAISRITLAVLVKIAGQRILDIRIASGAVTPIGKRFPRLESGVKGERISPALLQSLATELGREILNETGLRWSTPYKLPVVQQVFYQLLNKLVKDH